MSAVEVRRATVVEVGEVWVRLEEEEVVEGPTSVEDRRGVWELLVLERAISVEQGRAAAVALDRRAPVLAEVFYPDTNVAKLREVGPCLPRSEVSTVFGRRD